MSVEKKISVALCVRNEAEQLNACMSTLSFSDEIVVVLDRCTDSSKSIADKYNATIVEGNWPNEGARRHAAIDHCTGDWILEVDADERVSPALSIEIITVIKGVSDGYFLVPFDNYIGTQLVRYGWGGSWGVSAAPRLFTPGSKIWGKARIHPPLTLKGLRGRLREPMKHYVDKNLSDMIARLERYTNARAKDLLADNKTLCPFWWTIRRSISRFIKCYFFRKGYREGRWGFTIALMAALFPLIAHLKAELEQTACLDDKEKNDR